MPRRGDDVADRRHFDQPPRIHDPQAVDELRHQADVVADQDHRGAELGLHPAERFHDLPLYDHVERAGRLIGNDHFRPQTDRDGDAGALLHAAGQLVRVSVGNLRQ